MKNLIYLLTIVFSLVATDLHAQTYTVTDLGTIGPDDSSEASAINAAGQVVGITFAASNRFDTHAALFATGGNTALGFLGGTRSDARAINNSGQIVGGATESSGIGRAILFGNPNVNLGTLPGGSTSAAEAINASGTIVGESTDASTNLRATLFSSTNLDLGTLGGTTSAAAAINDSGVIVGYATLSDGFNRAAVFSGTGTGNTNLGTLGGSSSGAHAINASGTIVGEAETAAGLPHATRFSGTGTGNTDLGILSGSVSRALSINAGGLIVGEADTVNGSTTAFHGFIYRDGQMFDLNNLIPATSGVVISTARSINDLGQIAASGNFSDGRRRALCLDPVSTPPTVSYIVSVKRKPRSYGTVKGAGVFPSGTFITLRAKPKIGHTFVNWKEGRKIIGKRKRLSFVLTANRSITATFK